MLYSLFALTVFALPQAETGSPPALTLPTDFSGPPKFKDPVLAAKMIKELGLPAIGTKASE